MTDPISVVMSALSSLLSLESSEEYLGAVSLRDAVAKLDNQQTSETCAAITRHIEKSLVGDETSSSRRESLERWLDTLGRLYAIARETSNGALVDYLAQARMALLIDQLGWYAESLLWHSSVADHVSAGARQVLDGDAAGAALHLDQPDRAQPLVNDAILGAARLRDASSLARHYGTLAIVLARSEDFASALRSIEVALTFDAVANDDDSRRLKLRSDQATLAAAVDEAASAEG
jgi:hypothetical protein